MTGDTRPYLTTREERAAMRANGILCATCLYYGLAHAGDHLVPDTP